MAETKIEWTARHLPDGRVIPGFTFNPWKGCTHAGPDCLNCYAENLMDTRWGQVEWGPKGERKRTTAAYWKQPHKWNKLAASDGIKRLVFCASLADVLDDHPSIDPTWRRDLFEVIAQTPDLIWLMLTKRPQNFWNLIPLDRLPSNVWFGTSAGTQKMAEKRIPHLVEIPAAKHFLSLEPLLERVDLDLPHWQGTLWPNQIDWVIAGGESGPNARPMDVAWAYSIRDQCRKADTPFFMKQMGGVKRPFPSIPADLDIKEFPEIG